MSDIEEGRWKDSLWLIFKTREFGFIKVHTLLRLHIVLQMLNWNCILEFNRSVDFFPRTGGVRSMNEFAKRMWYGEKARGDMLSQTLDSKISLD